VVLITFFDYEGMVHHECVPQGQTVNTEFYLEVLRRLRELIRKKRPKSLKANQWMLHHDNALVQSSLLVRDFLTKTGHYSHSTTTLLAGSSACRLFSLPQAEIHLERTKICHHRDKRKFAHGPEGDTGTSVPGLLPKLEETLGTVY
jgi:hypothetical protein